jgi:hypothetical protein
LGGLALCAFFVLGIVVGVHSTGGFAALKDLGRRSALLDKALSALHIGTGVPPKGKIAGDTVALIERRDGFYALSADGDARGPLSANDADDLPVISGPGIESANLERLLDYAALIVRAEAALPATISELRVDRSGLISMFLRRSRTEIELDFDRASFELDRASLVFARWRGHQELIALLDMTTPGQAVMRVRGLDTRALAASIQRASLSRTGARRAALVEARR